MVAVLTPDRLARKYAYQVLLLEEFRRAGCEVAFLQHPISDDPNDQLLLQIQGAIASTSAPFWASASDAASCNGPATGTTRVGAPPTATATCAARTPCRATSSWTSRRPVWCA